MKKDYNKELQEIKEVKKSFINNTSESSKITEQNFNHLFSKNISDASDIIKALRPIINEPEKRREMVNDLINQSIFLRDLRNDYSNINSHSKLKIYTKKKGYFLNSDNNDLITNDVEDSIFFFLTILWDSLKAHYKDKAPDEFFLDLINLTEAGMDLYNQLVPSQLNYYKMELESTQAKIVKLELELSNLRLTESKIIDKIKEYEN